MLRWRQRLAGILEWSEVDKSLFVVAALTPIFVSYALGILFILSRPGHARFVNADVLQQVLGLQILFTAGAILIATLCLMVRQRNANALWVQHLATQYYTLTLVCSSYFVGTLTFSTGVVLLGAPVFGFILLHRRVVWMAALSGTAGLVALTYASALGYLPYAPAVVPPSDPASTLWWTHTLLLFSLPHVAVILLFADQTVSWWRQREQTIRALSSTDMLTGLHNRRSIMEQLEREVARSIRLGTPLSVVILDLDHFKKINDTWGHPTGDRALQEAAHTLRDALRLGDAIGRYGGEEFMMLLPGTGLEGAHILLERCRLLLAATEVTSDSGTPVSVSASFGLASNEFDTRLDAKTLVRLADSALYRAKEGGRNRVEAMESVAAA